MTDPLPTAPIPSTAYVVQDGEFFYIHADEAGENYVAFRECPKPVPFLDYAAAAEARGWLQQANPSTTFHFIDA